MKQILSPNSKPIVPRFIKQVQKTKRSIQVTRRGKVIAEIRPMPAEKRTNWLGSMNGTLKIEGDIISPVIDLEDIEALKD